MSQKLIDIAKAIFTILVFSLFLLLVGCFYIETVPLSQGVIVNKTFEPAGYYVQTENNTTLVGKVPITKTRDYIYEYDDRYIITIEGSFFGTEKTTKIYTSKETYNTVELNDKYSITEKDSTKEPYKKYRYIEGETPLPELPYIVPD